MDSRLTRRDFLLGSCALALSPSIAGARLLGSPGYRAVIRINLAGGNDAFNMIIPTSPEQYRSYQQWRGALALRRAHLLPLDDVGNSLPLALHPALVGIHALYSQKSISVLAGVGALLEPYNRQAVSDSRASLPDGLFAHRAQAAFWNGQRNARDTGCSDAEVAAFLCNAALEARCTRFNVNPLRPAQWSEIGVVGGGHIPAGSQLPLGHALDAAVQLIASRRCNPAARDLIEVHYEGWDHHSDAIAAHARALQSLDRGLVRLHANLISEGAQDEVMVVTNSEFGRALVPNTSGSDHGWSAHHFVMGGAVRGGVIFGAYPDLSPASTLHVGRGVFAPTLPVSLIHAEIATWVGLPAERVSQWLPSLLSFDFKRLMYA